MPIANQDEVRVILSNFEERIRGVVDAAWEEWREHPGKGRYLFARTRANILFDAIARLAIAEFDADPYIQVLPKAQTVQFLFQDQVLIRFKKGNAKGIGSNIETQAVLDFVDPQLSLPGLLKDVHRVEICYQTDALGTQVDNVAVVARDRTKKVWAYPIDRRHPGAEIHPLPQRGSDDTPPAVTPKRPKKTERRSGEE